MITKSKALLVVAYIATLTESTTLNEAKPEVINVRQEIADKVCAYTEIPEQCVHDTMDQSATVDHLTTIL